MTYEDAHRMCIHLLFCQRYGTVEGELAEK